MAKQPSKAVRKADDTPEASQTRTYPVHTIVEALAVAEKIQSEKGGRPFNRLLLAEALGYKPSSSNYRVLLSSSYKYGLTDGTEKAAEIGLTPLGAGASQHGDSRRRLAALRQAVIRPQLFHKSFEDYKSAKLPSATMMPKILTTDYKVPVQHADDCARIILENGRTAGIIRDISNAPYCMFDDSDAQPAQEDLPQPAARPSNGQEPAVPQQGSEQPILPAQGQPATVVQPPRAIFIGHGKKRGPLDKLVKILTSFQIPHKVVVDEANLGRPIPQKVRDTMLQCGSAILIFTCDQKFTNDQGEEVWRPSENVVHELGASSFAYEDRVVIFKEKGIHFPTNFQSIGYIEFEENAIEAKTADLLKELIGFGLVRVVTTP